MIKEKFVSDEIRRRANDEIEKLTSRVQKYGAKNERISIKLDLDLTGDDAIRYQMVRILAHGSSESDLAKMVISVGSSSVLLNTVYYAKLKGLLGDV